MTKKKFYPVLYIAIFSVAIAALINIRPVPEDLPEPITPIKAATIDPAPEPAPANYEIKFSDGVVCLYTLDESGTELDRKIIDYIDIYSLYKSQVDALRSGIKFDSREAAAEFIQDLGS